MKKIDSSREVLTWATLDRDILAIIFNKLNILDLTIGASRVCIHWFLVSHNKTLWNTIDLTKFKYEGKKVIYKHRVDDEALTLSNLLIKTSKYFNFCGVQGIKLSLIQKKRQGIKLKKLVIGMTKLSRAATQNLFLNFHSCIQDKDLTFVAKRMLNIEKLVLPVSPFLNRERSFRFAFSQWKNLETLILARSHYYYVLWTFMFKIVGQNCSNLTNLKMSTYLDICDIEQIVSYLQSLERLSLLYSSVSTSNVLALIRGLQNLTILNLTHCKDFSMPNNNYNGVQAEAATHQKLEKVIICSQYDCKFCKDPPYFGKLALYEKNWRNDEIKELEF